MSAVQPVKAVAVLGGALAVLSVLGGAAVAPGVEARGAQAGAQMPIFTWDPTWPQMPLPMQWTLGNVTGVTVDPDDHIWILQRPFSIAHGSEDGLEHDPPTASCCRMAPPVIEFDQAGNVGRSWGGPGAGYAWPEHAVEDMHERHDALRDWSGEHGVHADDSGHLWISNNAPKGSDAHVLKFDRDGRHVLTVGTVGKTEGSHDTTALGKPAGIAVNPRTNEVFIADGVRQPARHRLRCEQRRIQASLGRLRQASGRYGDRTRLRTGRAAPLPLQDSARDTDQRG